MESEEQILTRQRRMQAMRQRLSDSGHRITPQRLLILEALLTANMHPSVEEIYGRVRKVSPTTSLATVYKTLDTLKGLGEVQELEFGDRRYHYDGMDPTPHPHVVCTHCGKIQDVCVPTASELQAQAQVASGYHIAWQRVEFYGVCQDCQQTTGS